MGRIKHYLEMLSVQMGFGGEINTEVIDAAAKTMGAKQTKAEADQQAKFFKTKQRLERRADGIGS